MLILKDTPPHLEEKAAEITQVLAEPKVDLWKLRELALSEGGLVNDTLRKRAWPKLVGLHEACLEEQSERTIRTGNRSQVPRSRQLTEKEDNDDESIATNQTLPSSNTTSTRHRDKYIARSHDFDQIELDVARCTWHLLTGTQRTQRVQMEHKRHKKVAKLLRRKQRCLANLINLTLVKSYDMMDPDRLRYFQGYHDVACIFLSTLGAGYSSLGLELPANVLLQISKSHLRDCMKANFVQLQTALRLTVFPLIALLDPDVHALLYQCDMEPFFALSWVITWFSHEIRDTDLVKRLFDVFLVSHPLMPIYMAVAMVIHPYNRQEVLETDCDFALIHQALTGLPKNSSMVGWKYRPGDGYVSDDEQEDEGTMSTGAATENTGDFFVIPSGLHEKSRDHHRHHEEALSSMSSSVCTLDLPVRVPFQELIDSAIDLMNRIPPHRLLPLAERYYGKDQTQKIMATSGIISLFEVPPVWTRAATAKSDWVIKMKALERQSMFTSYLQKGSLKREMSGKTIREELDDTSDESDWEENDEMIQQVLEERAKSRAVIAAGFGRGDEERRRRRRQRIIIAGVITVAIVAVAVGVIMQSRQTAVIETPRGGTPAKTSAKVAQKVERKAATLPRYSDKVAAKHVAPKHVAPKQVAPKQVAPKQVAPKRVAPKQVLPDSANKASVPLVKRPAVPKVVPKGRLPAPPKASPLRTGVRVSIVPAFPPDIVNSENHSSIPAWLPGFGELSPGTMERPEPKDVVRAKSREVPASPTEPPFLFSFSEAMHERTSNEITRLGDFVGNFHRDVVQPGARTIAKNIFSESEGADSAIKSNTDKGRTVPVGTEETRALGLSSDIWLSFTKKVQMTASREFKILGSRLVDLRRAVVPRARSAVSKLMPEDGSLFVTKDVPGWMSLSSATQERAINEVSKLGRSLGEDNIATLRSCVRDLKRRTVYVIVNAQDSVIFEKLADLWKDVAEFAAQKVNFAGRAAEAWAELVDSREKLVAALNDVSDSSFLHHVGEELKDRVILPVARCIAGGIKDASVWVYY